MKKFCLLLFTFFACVFAFGEESLEIKGFWLITDTSHGGAPQSIVYIYENDNVHYCRMVGIYDENTGKLGDTIEHPKERAKGLKDNPFLCGTDFIWGLTPDGTRYKGNVVNPSSGSVYNCHVWYDTKTGKLVVRGECFIFGQNQYWLKMAEKDIPDKKVLKVSDFKPRAVKAKD